MAKIYLVKSDDGMPFEVFATAREAGAAVKIVAEFDPEIDVEDVPMTRAGVVEYINRRFGVASL